SSWRSRSRIRGPGPRTVAIRFCQLGATTCTKIVRTCKLLSGNCFRGEGFNANPLRFFVNYGDGAGVGLEPDNWNRLKIVGQYSLTTLPAAPIPIRIP